MTVWPISRPRAPCQPSLLNRAIFFTISLPKLAQCSSRGYGGTCRVCSGSRNCVLDSFAVEYVSKAFVFRGNVHAKANQVDARKTHPAGFMKQIETCCPNRSSAKSLYSSVVERQCCKLKVLGSIPSGGLCQMSSVGFISCKYFQMENVHDILFDLTGLKLIGNQFGPRCFVWQK